MLTVTMHLTKETKNTVRYDDTTPHEAERGIDCVYIKKHALPKPYPKAVTITIDMPLESLA